MSKGLKALDEISGYTEVATLAGYVEQPIKKVYKKEFAVIKEELKAIEIIKENAVDVIALRISINLEQYNCKENGLHPLTKEEYKLLKKVLE